MKNPKVGERVVLRQIGKIAEVEYDCVRVELDLGGNWLTTRHHLRRLVSKKRERTYTEEQFFFALGKWLGDYDDSKLPGYLKLTEILREGSGHASRG